MDDKKKTKLFKLADIADKGQIGIIEYIMEIEEKIDKEIPKFKTIIERVKGEKGDAPTEDDLIALITPLLAPLFKDYTPSRELLISLIKPLIPEVKNGYTPSKEDLLKIIKPLIPQISNESILKELRKVISKDIQVLLPDFKKIEEDIKTELVSELPQFGEQFRDGLELLQKGERLSINAVENLREELDEAKTRTGNQINTGFKSFRNLTDVPHSYSGQSGKVVKVKTDETGLEFGVGGGGSGTVTSVTGTANRTTITGTPTVAPIVDISATYAGQSSITTLGTVGTGVWQGTAVADSYISSATAWNAKFTLPALTSGSVLFSNGTTIAQDNANFFWDDTNNRLGIGTATPETFAHVHGPEVPLTSNGVGTFVISTPFKNSLYKSRMFFGIDNTTNTSLGTGFIQMRDINGNTNLNLHLNPNGGGVAINASTVIAGISEVPLLIGANPSNNGYIRLQNTSSYGGGSTPYTGLLFQQSTGTPHTYIKAGVIFNGYDGSGFARGQLLFALDPTASGVNVQDTLSTSTRMNIDYVAGVVTIGQGVTVGTGKLNVLATTGSQLRLNNTTSNYFDTTVSSTGSTTFALTGTTPLFTFSQGLQAPTIGVGTAPLTSTGLLVAGSGYTSNLIAATGSLSPTAGTNATLYRIAGTIVEAGSGTHNLMSAMFLGATTVTAGAATVNNTAGLYIEGPMTATVSGTNYAIWVDDGISRFDGKVILDDTLRLKGYLVADLPAGTQGDKAFVTNALAPTYLATVVGGGAIVTEVFHNGSTWVCT